MFNFRFEHDNTNYKSTQTDSCFAANFVIFSYEKTYRERSFQEHPLPGGIWDIGTLNTQFFIHKSRKNISIEAFRSLHD